MGTTRRSTGARAFAATPRSLWSSAPPTTAPASTPTTSTPTAAGAATTTGCSTSTCPCGPLKRRASSAGPACDSACLAPRTYSAWLPAGWLTRPPAPPARSQLVVQTSDYKVSNIGIIGVSWRRVPCSYRPPPEKQALPLDRPTPGARRALGMGLAQRTPSLGCVPRAEAHASGAALAGRGLPCFGLLCLFPSLFWVALPVSEYRAPLRPAGEPVPKDAKLPEEFPWVRRGDPEGRRQGEPPPAAP
jgi:hypothetical protein